MISLINTYIFIFTSRIGHLIREMLIHPINIITHERLDLLGEIE